MQGLGGSPSGTACCDVGGQLAQMRTSSQFHLALPLEDRDPVLFIPSPGVRQSASGRVGAYHVNIF